MNVFKTKKISLQTRLTLLVCTVVLVSISVTGYLIRSKAAENDRSYQAEKVMDIMSIIGKRYLCMVEL
jgi:two-component system, CitB family, sensor histidine kinase MalK